MQKKNKPKIKILIPDFKRFQFATRDSDQRGWSERQRSRIDRTTFPLGFDSYGDKRQRNSRTNLSFFESTPGNENSIPESNSSRRNVTVERNVQRQHQSPFSNEFIFFNFKCPNVESKSESKSEFETWRHEPRRSFALPQFSSAAVFKRELRWFWNFEELQSKSFTEWSEAIQFLF